MADLPEAVNLSDLAGISTITFGPEYVSSDDLKLPRWSAGASVSTKVDISSINDELRELLFGPGDPEPARMEIEWSVGECRWRGRIISCEQAGPSSWEVSIEPTHVWDPGLEEWHALLTPIDPDLLIRLLERGDHA